MLKLSRQSWLLWWAFLLARIVEGKHFSVPSNLSICSLFWRSVGTPFVLALGVLIGAMFCVVWPLAKATEHIQKRQSFSLVGEFIKAKKRKMCPLVKIVD